MLPGRTPSLQRWRYFGISSKSSICFGQDLLSRGYTNAAFVHSVAGNTAMLTLDSLSLLLSKQNPTQAGVTLSQQLRELVGIGTIGADKLDDSNVTPEKTEDQSNIALGWTLMEINKTRDAAEEASTFLQREVAAEGKYWEEVVAVQKSGWSISKVPHERHTLGVRFGFSEGMSPTRI